MQSTRTTFLLLCILLAAVSPFQGGMTVHWSEGKLDVPALECFLWGDDHHLLSMAGTFPETPSRPPGREDFLRMYYTEYARLTLSDNAPGGSAPVSAEVHFERYLLWRWLATRAAPEVPGDGELRRIHEERREDFMIPESFSFQRIFLPATDGDPLDAAGPRQRMETYREELMGGGTVEKLVRSHGLPENQARTLGPFRPGVIDPDLEAELTRLGPGDVSPVIKTEKGFHLLQLVERSEGSVTPFEDARPALVREALRPFLKGLYDDLLRDPDGAPAGTGPDEAAHQFLGAVSGRVLTPEEAETIRRAAIARALASDLPKDGEAERVRSWLERRKAGDAAFSAFAEAEVQRRMEEGAPAEILHDILGAKAAGRRLIAAEYLVVHEAEITPGDLRARHEAYIAAKELAGELAREWRGTGTWAHTSESIPESVEFHETPGLIGIPEAGRQLSEGVRGLEAGEVGEPVHSRSSRTFLVARLTETTRGTDEPTGADGYTRRQRTLLHNHFLREIKEEFRDLARSDPAFRIAGLEEHAGAP